MHKGFFSVTGENNFYMQVATRRKDNKLLLIRIEQKKLIFGKINI